MQLLGGNKLFKSFDLNEILIEIAVAYDIIYAVLLPEAGLSLEQLLL